MATANSVYVGHLSYRTTERDLEGFFRSFGRVRGVVMKTGFAFVQLDDSRAVDDACYELNGRELQGNRVTVEQCRGAPRPSRGDRDRHRERDSRRDDDRDGRRDDRGGPRTRAARYGPPVQTKNRLLVENLSTRCSWQDLKDFMRSAGEVTYADAHKKERNTAIVCFAHHDDLKRAIEKFQGKDINGRRIKLVDQTRLSGSRSPVRSRSRSRSPIKNRRSASRSYSRSPSPPPKDEPQDY